MSLSSVITTQQLDDVSSSEVGGKAANLQRLQQLGQRIPPFYVISADVMRQVAEAFSPADSSRNDELPPGVIQQQILDAEVPSDVVDAIAAAHAECFCPDTPVAVRSSAVTEDGVDHSFAGMHDSVLGVAGNAEVINAIRQVWASAFNSRAVAYCEQRGLPPFEAEMAVIVQQMIDARQSGVCFTCNPTTGSRDEIVIGAVYGLGEGLVARGYDADSFVVDRETLSITRQLADKRNQLVFDSVAGEITEVDVSENACEQSTLSDDQILQLARAATEIETEFGCPQDIEFSFDHEGQLFILQARPITGLDEKLSAHDSRSSTHNNRIVWDNSNIIESYAGVTTPMTFSFIRRAYSIVYHCFSEVMGISPRAVHEHRDAFDNMLGLFRGRVYYNLKNWYRLVRLFPGYRYNSRFMESMMGLKEPLYLDDEEEQPGLLRRWFVEFPLLLRLLVRSGWNFLRIRSKVAQFQEHFHKHYDEWSQLDFDGMPPHEIIALHAKMEEALLWNWKAPIINDFYVMVNYGILKKLCANWCGDESGSLQNGLIAGEGGLQSDEPAKLLIQMAGIAHKNDTLHQLILHQPVEDLPTLIAADNRFEEFNRLMSRYLDEYGLRCANELKLEAYSYRDEPHRLYQMIRNYLTCDDPSLCDLESIEARERNVRRDAEQQCERALESLRSWWPRRTLFKRVLRNARLGVRNRENMRFARTRIYGILRNMLRSIGQHLADEGVLDHREDIFYLTIDEVWDFVKGTAVSTDLRGLAELRRAEYDSYRDGSLPSPTDHFETCGMAYHDNSFQQMPSADATSGNEVLAGVGCCPGIVTGKVQLVRDPTSGTSFDGDILVAERTDPGWVPLYPAFRGILIERGSQLSHSAIVAREMGIPTIVGISGLTARLRSGDCVQMDGRAGTVEVNKSRGPTQNPACGFADQKVSAV